MSDRTSIRMVPQPKRLRIKLFDHQLASIYQMEKLEREQVVEREIPPGELRAATIQTETHLGINADPTGYGKTLSMIGLVVRNKMRWDMDTPHTREKITTESAGLVRSRIVNRYEKLPTTLVLVSPSILIQWQRELSRTDLTLGMVVTKKDVDDIDAAECDVVLVTTSMYNYLVRSYSRYAWKRLIFDEPGHARVPGMKDVRAGFYWFVTATPNAITVKHRNCRGSFMKKIIGDNWCDFEVQFGDLIIRNDEEFVRSSFTIPSSEHFYYQCFQPLSNTVAGLVPPIITTMIEAGNIEGAITALGGSRTRNIVALVKKKKLEELEEARHKIRMYTIREDEEQVKTWTTRQVRVQTQISELGIRFSTMLSGPCFICREELKDPVLEPCCQNLFCGECLFTWLKRKKSCPTCRTNIQLNNLIYVNTKKEPDTGNTENKVTLPQTKIDKVVQLIHSNKQGKFLIFSTYDASFEPICRVLEENKISYALLKGSSKTRQRNIDQFKAGEIQVIFLNSNFNGAGINLQETTDLILYHRMSQVIRNQIVGRAERIGRKDPLRIHHLQVHI
jgi:SNF2 family DNA or RNA helicase